MKKILALAIAAMLALTLFAGCGAASSNPELALITDIGTIDDKSFNQGAWEGLVKYAEEHKIGHQYYQPTEKSTTAYLESIDQAVQNGAKVVVTPGYLFEDSVFVAQDQYPDVKFILIDGTPHDADYKEFKTAENTVGITFAEEQVGFLAGYAAVKEGLTKLGFMGGMAVPAVVKYGYGFVQGAEYAAQELGLADGSIEIVYNYTGGFSATPEAQNQAAAWYNNGTEVIFAAGGAVGNSVMAAAEAVGAKVIGVDVDQSGESDTVITSALKGLGISVYDMLKAYYDGNFPGGQNLVFDAANNGVSLAMDTAKFENFKKADYDTLFAALQNDTNGISSNILKNVDENGKDILLADLPLKAVSVTEVK